MEACLTGTAVSFVSSRLLADGSTRLTFTSRDSLTFLQLDLDPNELNELLNEVELACQITQGPAA